MHCTAPLPCLILQWLTQPNSRTAFVASNQMAQAIVMCIPQAAIQMRDPVAAFMSLF